MWHLGRIGTFTCAGAWLGCGAYTGCTPLLCTVVGGRFPLHSTDRQTDGEAVSKQPEGNH